MQFVNGHDIGVCRADMRFFHSAKSYLMPKELSYLKCFFSYLKIQE